MKNIILSLSLVVCSLSAFASNIQPGEALLDYTCGIYKKANSPKYSVKVLATATAPNKENVSIPANLIITRIVAIGADVMIIPRIFPGAFQYADVVNNFVSTDGKTALTLYADELDQTIYETEFNGKNETTRFDCGN